MTSEIAPSGLPQEPGSASEITKRRPGARPTRLPPVYGTVLGEYAAALERAPLSDETARISEVVRLDVGDVQMSARKGRMRLYGKGGKFREIDIHPKLRTELQLWLDERPNWPHADDNRALFLNAKGGRLTARAASGIIAEIAQTAGLDDPTTAHVLRHTLATTLVRGKTDMVLVAEILGHARLETTRRYSLPSDKDKEDALKLITVDR